MHYYLITTLNDHDGKVFWEEYIGKSKDKAIELLNEKRQTGYHGDGQPIYFYSIKTSEKELEQYCDGFSDMYRPRTIFKTNIKNKIKKKIKKIKNFFNNVENILWLSALAIMIISILYIVAEIICRIYYFINQ